MEEALYVWFGQLQARDLAINEGMLNEKARELGKQTGVAEDLRYSLGWLPNFRKRYGVKSCVLHGQARDANPEGIYPARANLRLLLEGYTAEDTYNQDETGILWRQQPTRTLAIGKKAGLKKEKERVTVSLMCNAAGSDKRPLVFIGKAKRRRSFPNSFQPKRDLGIQYANIASAWMTTRVLGVYQRAQL
jgi:hypothetical protein